MAEERNMLSDDYGFEYHYEEIHNWTDLEHILNFTYSECDVNLNENVKLVFLFLIYLVIFIMGLAGNLLVLWVNWQSRRSKTSINIYIINMAVADLGVALTLPVWMLESMLEYTWLWGGFLCKFTHYFYFGNMFSSIFFLTALSVDRYLSITSSSVYWRQNQQRIRRVLCVGIWIMSAIFPLPEIVHMKQINSGDPICIFMAPLESFDEWSIAVSLLTIIVGFLIPFPIILVLNLMTAYHIKRSSRPESQKHHYLVYAYILTFLFSWLPYHVTLLLIVLHGNYIILHCKLVHILYFFYDIIDCISLLHCVINPILYNFLSKDFKGKFINAVVKYIPKDKINGAKQEERSTSTTEHSIVITKENVQQVNHLQPLPTA
ncbi:hypothetical protein GDO86_004314 [Hymenochirus boettgeri]|uniref:G-protein coupled receptors family 1 profile domain-containing protein n=1 Tax=Hymenochirus boettgeri TaxID=247094 RepID=A0A8T2K4P3_9PIPI|nr:hypothetical protein GDO86_004314 [Hymenochirus boettgeri]